MPEIITGTPKCATCGSYMLRLAATQEWGCWICSVKITDSSLASRFEQWKRQAIYGNAQKKVEWGKKQETWDLFKPRQDAPLASALALIQKEMDRRGEAYVKF